MVTPPTPRSSRSGSRSRSGRSRSRRPAPSSNNAQVVAIGAGAVVVVALGVWLLNNGGGTEPARQPAGKQPPARDAVADKEPAGQVPAVHTTGKPGKTPDTPAPEILEADVAKAEALYREARSLDLEARRAQRKGDHTSFNRLINDAWDKLEEVGPLIQRYEDWYEEADLSDWAIPASYLRYRKRVEKIDKLRGRVRKVRPMRRK